MIPIMNEAESEANVFNRKCSGPFLSGVVEGFYGRPWTMEQRRKLFTRMVALNMNTYLYAPKDDLKHRKLWRDTYTVDEAEPLTALIQSAREIGVTFVYALSPGLDITYSSAKEIACLKHKLEQVASFGCEAFALLFDDIEVELCDADKLLFQSFAEAQVSVTNEVYQHLQQPSQFLFCPTEYCASRAVPTVLQSEYLNTIGSKLLPNIDVMWTGPKVVSRHITVNSIEEVSRILRRPPVIWDNFHANDYDPKRLFLGPYDGRSPKLVPHLRGVLTNPNCEFESNFVAINTLAQWCQTSDDGTSQGKKDFILNAGSVVADIRLETESENDGSSEEEDVETQEPVCSTQTKYTPRQALRQAVDLWVAEFSIVTPPMGELLCKNYLPVDPVVPKIIAQSIPAIPVVRTSSVVADQMAILEADVFIKPVDSPETVTIVHEPLEYPSPSTSTVSSGIDVEPMDCIITPSSTPVSVVSNTPSATNSVTVGNSDDSDSDDAGVVADEITAISCGLPSSENMQVDSDSSSTAVTVDDVSTLVDMFYLPFEYGPRAARLLRDFFWIKVHAAELLGSEHCNSSDQLFGLECDDCNSEFVNKVSSGIHFPYWRQRVHSLQSRLRQICESIDRIIESPNRSLAYELFPYLWDIKAVLLLLDNFVQWLADCLKPMAVSRYVLYGSPFTWANKFYRAEVASGDQEPWLFRGGLLGEIQRMLPFENSPDLLFYPCPPSPQTLMYRVRPYRNTDKEAVYSICLKTSEDGAAGPNTHPNCADFLPDKLVSPFLTHSAENCFVITDRDQVCGYVLSAPDANSFHNDLTNRWIPQFMEKYASEIVPEEEVITAFHTPFKPTDVPADWVQTIVHISILPDKMDSVLGDTSIAKRAFSYAVSTLKVLGARSVYTCVSAKHQNTIQMYRNIGFFDLTPPSEKVIEQDVRLLGRFI